MKLFNVRKGQFVYYNNQLHKVYAIKPFFRRSVHLIRLRDYKQQLVRARDIDFYQPKHLDSFICFHKRYTLDKNKRANIGDYILVTNPKPDSIDSHYLHAIEMVASIESYGIISNKSNGIKHHEYWVMVPELLEGATKIDWQQLDGETPEEYEEAQDDKFSIDTYTPKIGDVFQMNHHHEKYQTMVLSVDGEKVYLGGGIEVNIDQLNDTSQWTYLFNTFENK